MFTLRIQLRALRAAGAVVFARHVLRLAGLLPLNGIGTGRL